MAADPLLVSDVTGASAAANSNLSLYLMPTSDTLGLTIFDGGGTSTPELSFDVVTTPEPATGCLVLAAACPLLRRKRRVIRTRITAPARSFDPWSAGPSSGPGRAASIER